MESAIKSGGCRTRELFDLEADSGEQTNFAATKPEIVNRMKQRLLGINARVTADGTDWHRAQLSKFRTMTNVAAAHPDIVKRLTAAADAARRDLGDSLQKVTGTGLLKPGIDTTSSGQ